MSIAPALSSLLGEGATEIPFPGGETGWLPHRTLWPPLLLLNVPHCDPLDVSAVSLVVAACGFLALQLNWFQGFPLCVLGVMRREGCVSVWGCLFTWKSLTVSNLNFSESANIFIKFP